MKKAVLRLSLIFTGWYCLSFVLNLYTAAETQLTGAAYTVFVLCTRLGMGAELYGALMYYLFPLVFFGLAIFAVFEIKTLTGLECVLFCLPPIAVGVPTVFWLLCIALHWAPFGMEIHIYPLYNLIVYIAWFFVCLWLLCKPKIMQKRKL